MKNIEGESRDFVIATPHVQEKTPVSRKGGGVKIFVIRKLYVQEETRLTAGCIH